MIGSVNFGCVIKVYSTSQSCAPIHSGDLEARRSITTKSCKIDILPYFYHHGECCTNGVYCVFY